MQRRTCHARPGFVFYILPPGGGLYFYGVHADRGRAAKREEGREKERDAGAAGSRLSSKNRTGNQYTGHEAPPSLYVERVTPPLLARTCT